MSINVTPPPRDPWAEGVRASDVPVAADAAASAEPFDTFEKYGVETGPKHVPRVEFPDVKAASLRSLESIIAWLLPGGKRTGNEWVVRNPTRVDAKPGSFSVNMRTGVWKDFSTDEGGADMIDLYAYLKGGTNVQAKDALADFLGVQAGQQRVASPAPTKSKAASTVIAVSELNEPPKAFPSRTPPDKEGKPKFIVAGDEGPKPRSSEKRRHAYRKGGVPVRFKIINQGGGGLNAYRVEDTDGSTGWQFKKPEGYADIPYIVADTDPLAAKINQTIFWCEGEKDVETVARLGGLAFTFGGCGDGLPSGCEQCVVGRNVVTLADNDETGRKHAEEKAALAAPVATSVKVIHFRELEDKQDVSDWAAVEGNTLEALMARVEAAEMWKPSQAVAPRARSIQVGDFIAYLPMHSYIYIPTRDLWAAVAVNSQLPPLPVLKEDGTRAVGPETKDKSGATQAGKPLSIKANTWLDQNQAVEQMTWAPGQPTLIHDRLISEGGWFDHPGAACFNLYKPPTIKLGDPAKAGRWVDHIKRVYPDDADHIISWLAYRVQHPEIKINHNLVLLGHPGVGKDTMLEPAVQAVGPWNCTEIAPDDLFGSFSGYLKSIILRVSEARDMGDVNKFQLYERMKTIGAAPPEVLRVNEEHLKEHSIVNLVGVIITSNSKTDSLYLPADDRRHYVAWSDIKHADFDNQPGAGDASVYFDALWRWYEHEGGFEDVAAYLASHDISDFNPKASPKKTAAFWEIVTSNRSIEESEILDVLDMIGTPPALIIDRVIASAPADLSDFLRERKNRRVASKRMTDAGYEAVSNPDAADGLWKVDGARRTVFAASNLTAGAHQGCPTGGCRCHLAGQGWRLAVGETDLSYAVYADLCRSPFCGNNVTIGGAGRVPLSVISFFLLLLISVS